MDYIINPFPGGSSLGMPPSFYPVLGIAGQAYQTDSNGNVITDNDGNPYIINTTSSGAGSSVTTSKNPNVISNIPAIENILPGVNNWLLLIGIGAAAVTAIIYFGPKRAGQNG